MRSFLVALLEGEWDCSDVSPGFWLGLTACKCLTWGDAAGGGCGLTEVPHPVVPKGEFVHGGMMQIGVGAPGCARCCVF